MYIYIYTYVYVYIYICKYTYSHGPLYIGYIQKPKCLDDTAVARAGASLRVQVQPWSQALMAIGNFRLEPKESTWRWEENKAKTVYLSNTYQIISMLSSI